MRINQKVDFFSDEFRPPVITFPASQIARLLGVFAVLMFAAAAVLYYPMPEMESKITKLQEQLKVKKQALEDTKKNYPKKVKSKSLEAQLVSIQEQNNNKVRLLNYLKSDTLREAQAFSKVFHDLKKYDHKQVWLTRIDLLSEGQRMRLMGLVSQPDVLPGYIDGLKQATSFHGRSFNLFNLERGKDEKGYLHFTLSTDAGADNNEG